MWSPGAKAIPNPHAATQKSHRVARKKMPAMTPGSAAAIVQLDGDHLSLVLAELWKSWAEAPKAAAVSKAFNRASKEARVLTKSMDIAVVRMPLAANESLNPKISEAQDNVLIESWGKTLENYAPHGNTSVFPGWCTGAVEKSDMTRVLDMGQGWLTNFAIDAFYKTLMPALEDAKLGDENIFMYGASSWTVEREGVLGYVVERVEGTVDTERTAALRGRLVPILKAAKRIHVPYNSNNKHWAHHRLSPQDEILEIYDSTGHSTAEQGRKLLVAYAELTGIDTSAWKIRIYEASAQGMAQQRDGKACGIFACITAAHLVCDAKLPDIQSDVTAWRRYIAARINVACKRE